MNKLPLVIDYTLFKRKKNQPVRTGTYPVGERIHSKEGVKDELLYNNSSEAEYAISFYLIMAGIFGPLPEERVDNIAQNKIGKEEELLLKKFNKDYRVLPIWNKIYVKKK